MARKLTQLFAQHFRRERRGCAFPERRPAEAAGIGVLGYDDAERCLGPREQHLRVSLSEGGLPQPR